ncbi:MAG: poly-gamma-glutamate system protein [Acidobacteria bacterium]|nr:poly-gamma-glutamate system protein [Acidobacteriota bacterium]
MAILAACAALLATISAGSRDTGITAGPAPAAWNRSQIAASRLMARSLDSVRRLRLAKGLPIDRTLDPNQTGIIGEEFTPLTTSLGEAEAKRTSANPAFAAVVARYFQDAGLSRGDVVAIGASGSFPALLLATLCAARALDLHPIVIYSIGASMYGANLPGFTFVQMLAQLRADGLLPYELAAVSPGGDQDGGTGVLFDEEGTTLVAEARRSGLPMVEGATLAERIRRRLRIYERAAGTRPVRCFVNVGGASANFGETPASLELRNGLLLKMVDVPASPTRGLVFEFGARGIPVVHLLHVRGLARDNGLPYDSGAG